MPAIRSPVTLLCFCALLGVSASTSAVTITLFGPGPFQSSLRSQASESSGSDIDTFTPAAVPFSTTLNSQHNDTTAITQYAFTGNVFESLFDHVIGTDPGDDARTVGTLSFSVDTNIAYLIEGLYTAQATNRYLMRQFVSLINNSTSAILFDGQQESIDIANESFTVGLTEGVSPFLVSVANGALSGMLTAGQVYTFSYQARINQLPDAPGLESANSADGFFRLTLGDAAATVSEPPVALLLALGACAIAWRRTVTTRG